MTRSAHQALWERLLEEADAVVKATRRKLPAPLRERAEAIPVTYEHVPSKALQDDGIAADTMGLFAGSTFEEEGMFELPPQIILYLDNIWEDAAKELDEYRFQVRQTLLHELGHYLGLDEGELEARDLE